MPHRRRHRTGAARHAPSLPRRNLPADRSGCVDQPRPCPYVSCRHHLALDVKVNGRLKVIHADVSKMQESCSLDVAARVARQGGDLGQREVGDMLGMTHQRVHQIEQEAMAKLRAALAYAVAEGL